MNPEEFNKLEDVFNQARVLPPDEREALLDEACGGNPELRTQVVRLLDHDNREEDSFLETPATWSWTDVQPKPERIGQYKIQRLLASGGMGTVYLATQDHPRRSVALKVMKAGITSRSALLRFEHESEVLARLRHPGIAQVYEAGTHDEIGGEVPYFAMEYVPDARPITVYADQADLDTSARLALFAQVCEAVHHGHQKGIIHRDLKPGNILVDASGQPKIIDFGVARATDSDLAFTTVQTDVGQLIGTLQYMSPEQCDADPNDLDTRSDVYALGVLLYELLCRRLPYDIARVAIHEAARIIREAAPERPSTISRNLRGDLETITLKALEKNRQRRYQSAADLAQDIQRFLHSEPIDARPASVVYQVRMLAKRNKTLFGSVAAVFVGLVLAVVGMTWGLAESKRAEAETARQRDAAEAAERAEAAQRQTAEEQRDRADRLFKQGHELARVAMGDFYLEIVDLPGTLPARRMLVDEALKYLEAMERDAGDDIDLRNDVAWGHRRLGQMIGGTRDPSLGRSGEAIEHYEKALAINREIFETAPENRENRRGMALGHIYMGDALNAMRQRDQALASYEEALSIVRELFATDENSDEDRRLLAVAELKVGGMKRLTQGAEAAEAHYARSAELRKARVRDYPEDDQALYELTVGHTRIAELLRMKGNSLKKQDDSEGAMELYGEALGHYEFVLRTCLEIAGRDPHSSRRRRHIMNTHLLMAPLHTAMGDADETVAQLEQAMAIAEQLFDCDSRDERTRQQSATTRRLLAYSLINAGRNVEGMLELEKALAEFESLASDFPDDPKIQGDLEAIRKVLSDLMTEEEIDRP